MKREELARIITEAMGNSMADSDDSVYIDLDCGIDEVCIDGWFNMLKVAEIVIDRLRLEGYVPDDPKTAVKLFKEHLE